MAINHGSYGAYNSPPRTQFITGHSTLPDNLNPPAPVEIDTTKDDPFLEAGEEAPTDWKDIATAILELVSYEETRKVLFATKADEAMALYNNEYAAHDDKASWQSKNKIPKGFMLVEKLTSVFMRYLQIQNTEKWLHCEAAIPQKQIFMNLAREYILFWLNQDYLKFRKVIRNLFKNGIIKGSMSLLIILEQDGIDVIEEVDKLFADGAEIDDDIIGLGLGFLKQQDTDKPEDDEDRGVLMPNNDMPRLRLQVIDFNNIWVDTGNDDRPRYKIWSSSDCVGGFKREAEKRGYDKAAVDRACKRLGTAHQAPSGHKQRADHESENMPAGGGGDVDLSNQVIYYHFEGTLPRLKDGEFIFEKKYALVANGELMFEPIDLPFWDGESAVVHAPFIEHPSNAVYGKSILGENIDTILSQVEMINLMMDFFLRVMLSMYEVDKNMLDENEGNQLAGGMGPGKILYTRNVNGQAGKAVTPVPAGDLPAGTWNAIQFFQNMVAEATGLTSELAGMPRTRGRQSAEEHMSRKAESGSLMEIIFNAIEDNLLNPMMRLIHLRSLQGVSDSYWKTWILSRMNKILPDRNKDPQLHAEWKKELEACANWTAQERYKNLGAFMRFRVKIFTNLLERQALVEQIQFLLNAVARLGPQAMQMFNIQAIVGELCELFGMDKEKILNPQFVPKPFAGDEINTTEELVGVPNMMGGLGEEFQPGTATPGSPRGFQDSFPGPRPGPPGL